MARVSLGSVPAGPTSALLDLGGGHATAMTRSISVSRAGASKRSPVATRSASIRKSLTRQTGRDARRRLAVVATGGRLQAGDGASAAWPVRLSFCFASTLVTLSWRPTIARSCLSMKSGGASVTAHGRRLFVVGDDLCSFRSVRSVTILSKPDVVSWWTSSGAVDVDHLVVPGRHDLAVLRLRRIPPRRDVAVDDGDDQQRAGPGSGLPLRVGARNVGPNRGELVVDDERQGCGLQLCRSGRSPVEWVTR